MKTLKLHPFLLISTFLVTGCSVIPVEITELAREQPLLAVAAGAAIGAATVVSGGTALIGIGVAGAGLTAAYGVEKKMGAELDQMIATGDCEGVKAFAARNYYSPMQRKSVLDIACDKNVAPSSVTSKSQSVSSGVVAVAQDRIPQDIPPPATVTNTPNTAAISGRPPTRQTVIWAQKILKRLGLLASPSNGNLGPKTTEAIKRFQSSVSIDATGALDDQTIAALNDADRKIPKERVLRPETEKEIKPEPKPTPTGKSIDAL